ncbi:hydantoinase/oxoprolinase family protein [Pusillimonas sp. SM2304]|uniref:hydantoinase/oxoprolinase family protein n=1 Tax=Pusillimonas sp. SM2304 TaxID=3073241 RepID=UPI00287576D5|nr:hydantoinase/oxoprolinase family protein [Pusillimonas sp. SM2304]MDS1139202.1 hydantoinase/oxoprolinase family protein [Pusillimonas sp. SM2304]
MRIGVEVGGTFTDLVAIGVDGVQVLKVPSTPSHPDEGAFNALTASGIPLGDVIDLAHGSTVATNAVLERKGFKTAFITTQGFRDILSLQRHGRSNIYDLAYQKPEPVVERHDSLEVAERVLANGEILTRLDPEAVKQSLIPALTKGGYQAVAICLLNAYVNPAHEHLLRQLLADALPDLHVTVSSDITREFREYERASTTALSAYVQPVMDRYVSRFIQRLEASEFMGRFSVMQSNGGKLPAEAMRANAISALLSGPAAGVMGAARQVARSGYSNLITLDMGGTSTDVCVVVDGKPQLTNEFSIDGLPVRIPVLDINTVGAGGGSIIWIDEGGMLRVGPKSAGAVPGPACYGKGGEQPTVTDAHVIRRAILPETFLGGRMPIDSERASASLQPIADHFGMTLEEAADSAIQLSNANIVRAIQVISTERGHDPRDNVLVPYGGAGPLHAAQVASDLGIRTIVVPPNSGVISAYGLLASDFIQFESLTRRGVLGDESAEVIRHVFQDMSERAIARARDMSLDGEFILSFVVYMRFVGQAFEVPVELVTTDLDSLTPARLRELFGLMHQKLFFFGAEDDKPIEYVSFRLGLTAPLEKVPQLSESEAHFTEPRTIELFDQGRWREAKLISRAAMEVDQVFAGPALLEDATSTLLVPTGWDAHRDSHDNTILTRSDDHA